MFIFLFYSFIDRMPINGVKSLQIRLHAFILNKMFFPYVTFSSWLSYSLITLMIFVIETSSLQFCNGQLIFFYPHVIFI